MYDNMLTLLKAGSIDLAVTSITTTQREQFRQYFMSLGVGLTAQVNALGIITAATVSEDFAYLTIVRTEIDGQYGYRIYLVRDGDVVWRIDGM